MALLLPLGINSVLLTELLKHVFLGYFTEGWFVLALLGLLYTLLPDPEGNLGLHGIRLTAIGIPLTFLLGMPDTLLHETVSAPRGAL